MAVRELKSLEDVAVAVAAIGRAEDEVAGIVARLKEAARIAAENAAPAVKACQKDAKDFRSAVARFAKKHPDVFPKDRRSVDLATGRFGYREVRSIEFDWAEDKIVAALISRDLAAAVIVTETPNKQILATYDDETLALVGTRRKIADKFFIEPAKAPAAR